MIRNQNFSVPDDHLGNGDTRRIGLGLTGLRVLYRMVNSAPSDPAPAT